MRGRFACLVRQAGSLATAGCAYLEDGFLELAAKRLREAADLLQRASSDHADAAAVMARRVLAEKLRGIG